jgi:1,4-alpha-glucan branching enzyme
MTAPRVITVSPLKLIPVAAVVIALAVFVTTAYLPERDIPFGLEQGQQKLVSVTFTFQHPGAHSVSLIGSFNQWNPVGFEMHQKGEEKVWLLELRLPVGRHHYAFLVNDELILTDPNTPFSARDGFGNKNSIIFVSNEYEKTI